MQAEDGIGLPEEILDQSSFETKAKLYFLFIRFDFLWSLNCFALIVLNFFEVSRSPNELIYFVYAVAVPFGKGLFINILFIGCHKVSIKTAMLFLINF